MCGVVGEIEEEGTVVVAIEERDGRVLVDLLHPGLVEGRLVRHFAISIEGRAAVVAVDAPNGRQAPIEGQRRRAVPGCHLPTMLVAYPAAEISGSRISSSATRVKAPWARRAHSMG